jgi:hypothetical protein
MNILVPNVTDTLNKTDSDPYVKRQLSNGQAAISPDQLITKDVLSVQL